jgi:hypothetical protein
MPQPPSTQPTQPRPSIPALTGLKPFDPANGWVLFASVEVEDGSKPADVQLATEMLIEEKKALAAIVSLGIVDRFSLSSKVR